MKDSATFFFFVQIVLLAHSSRKAEILTELKQQHQIELKLTHDLCFRQKHRELENRKN